MSSPGQRLEACSGLPWVRSSSSRGWVFLRDVPSLCGCSSSDVSGSVAGGYGGSQGDRGGLGSVLRDLVKPGDENLREMNKKLQNMLEEQLTKNMHLQKVRTRTHTHIQQPRGCGKRTEGVSVQDLELLSQELVRLSKDGGPAGSRSE